MITYQKLVAHPQAAKSIVGMSLEGFDELFKAFAEAHDQRMEQEPHAHYSGERRQRAYGGGRKPKYDLRDRLIMTLFWLKAYTTYEVLGFFYELNKTNIEDNLKAILATLDRMTQFNFERPNAERRKLHSPEAVMEAFPQVRLVIDAKEQRIQRPKTPKGGSGQNEQKPYYSGKKKAHTLKSQIAVQPNGHIEAVSESVPGGANHDLNLLRQSKLLDQLDQDEEAMLDKGYDGIQKDYPNLRLTLPFKARRNHPLEEDQKAYNRLVSRYRIVVEHTLAQMNRFQVLSQVYRHSRKGHGSLVRIVAGLVNRCIDAKPLKIYASLT
jgi:hypothetical protein